MGTTALHGQAYLDKQVDALEVQELVVCGVHCKHKVETSIPPVHQLVGLELRGTGKGVPVVDSIKVLVARIRHHVILKDASNARDLQSPPHLDEVCKFGVPVDDESVHLVLQSLLVFIRQWGVVLCKPCLARSIEKEEEPDHGLARRDRGGPGCSRPGNGLIHVSPTPGWERQSEIDCLCARRSEAPVCGRFRRVAEQVTVEGSILWWGHVSQPAYT